MLVSDDLSYLDEFCGMGGSTAGAVNVPGLVPIFAANHNEQAIATHRANHPDMEHYLGDVQKIRVAKVFPEPRSIGPRPHAPTGAMPRASNAPSTAPISSLYGAHR